MISAAELRIGNWIEATQLGGIYGKVAALPKEGLMIEGFDFKILYASQDPIPLTPEILEKAGFEKQKTDDDTVYYTLRLNDNLHCDLSLIEGDKNGICEVCLFPYEDYFRYKYVHQIQNLVQSLTGKELNLQL